MEHFRDPIARLREMTIALVPNGRLYMTFAPWLSPYGSHLQFMTLMPWINVLFSERTIMAVRPRYKSDGATSYQEVRGGLNKMTLARLERMASRIGLLAVYRKDICVLSLSPVSKVPLVREYLTYQVNSVFALQAASPEVCVDEQS